MKMKNNLFLLLSILYGCSVFGQLETYNKKAKLNGISEQWHSITIPKTVFKEVKDDLTDIRIYGITPNDTLEAPYILNILKGKTTKKQINFKRLNTTKNSKGHYFTYETNTNEILNSLQLNFKNSNFDWPVTLEGSQNQNEWFTILEDYRILSITNNQTSYRFTTLNFKDSKFKYYRVLIKTEEEPIVNSASIFKNDTIKASYQEYEIKNFKTSEKEKTTLITIDLNQKAPISYLKLNVENKIDYYRSIEFQYIADSVNTEKGWKYSYKNMGSDMLTSLENNEFSFRNTIAKKIRIQVRNYDNQPLKIKSAEVKGYVHQLTARFSEPADYYLTYGNPLIYAPNYDIAQVGFNIPKKASLLKLEAEEVIPHKEKPTVAPLFENEWWLWGIMGVVMLVLGGFTLKMMQKKA